MSFHSFGIARKRRDRVTLLERLLDDMPADAAGRSEDDGTLIPEWIIDEATDILWTLLSIPVWEQLRQQCGWSNDVREPRYDPSAARAGA